MTEDTTLAANSEPDFQTLSRSQRRSPLLWIIMVVVAVVCVGSLPSPYVVERPGPVVNTLGTVTLGKHEKPVLKIHGAERYKTSGALNLLTVNVLGTPENRVTWFGLIQPLLSKSQEIMPLKEMFPDGQTANERKTANAAQMTSSQDEATAAALNHLGYAVKGEVSVAGVGEGFPAAKVLKPKDKILRVEGKEVNGVGQLRSLIQKKAGSAVTIEFLRGSQKHTESVKPVELESGDWVLGVGIKTEFQFPVDVEFAVEDIGGPSAGMIFSLAIIDELTPGPLTDGKSISGTGTVDDTGVVGPIGGLNQKMWAASSEGTDLFIMPKGNCGDVPKQIPGGMKVAVVKNLDEAEQAVQTYTNGADPKGLAECKAHDSAD